MNDVIAAALALQTVCQEHGWRFCFIGGIAEQRWSEPRFEQKITRYNQPFTRIKRTRRRK